MLTYIQNPKNIRAHGIMRKVFAYDLKPDANCIKNMDDTTASYILKKVRSSLEHHLLYKALSSAFHGTLSKLQPSMRQLTTP